jgi:hypothetical protein
MNAELAPKPPAPEPLGRYQDMRFCWNCGGQRIFLPVYECEAGRVGVCLGCGDERIAPFTRTTGEAA